MQQWLLVSVLVGLVYVYLWNERRRSGRSVSFHEATRMINANEAVMLDLREGSEFKQGHIVDAVNIPFAKVKDRMSEIEALKDKTIILVDKMGQHSGSVGRDLNKLGLSVCRLEGGMTEWISQKLPVVKA
nr:rhodanese-like domain-containing protein [Marinibactrum halimedae]